MHEYFRTWSNVSLPFVDTNKYDIVQGKAIERVDYKINRLKEEKESIESVIKHYENSIIKYSQRLEEVTKELTELEP